MPDELATFHEADWVGVDAAQRYSAWMRARMKWGDAHGLDELPDEEATWAAFPDGEWREDEV
jgi:hypothetical protein